MSPFYADDSVTLHHGDCLDVLRELPDASVDAVVTDPPYGLEFMGREWDKFTDSRAYIRGVSERDAERAAEQDGMTARRRNAPESYVAGSAFQSWCAEWAAECLRVLKPGGHMLAFGGSRTWHRLAAAVEDAGFEIRDSIAWLYGSGFPKSLDVSKAIDKAAGVERTVLGIRNDKGRTQTFAGGETRPTLETEPATAAAAAWDGWGTALKPAFEPIVVGRKPLTGTVAANVLAWGCGAINVSGCRIRPDGGGPEGGGSQAGARGCPVHGLPGMRNSDEKGEVSCSSGQDARDVLPVVPEQADDPRAESPLERRGLDGQAERLSNRVGRAPIAGGPGPAADSASAGVPRASVGDGAEGRAPTSTGRDGAPHQRREGGQPPREFTPDGLGGPLPGTPTDRAGTGRVAIGERPTAGCTCVSDCEVTPAGRWPANVVLDESQADELDRQSGERKSSGVYQGDGSRNPGDPSIDFGGGNRPASMFNDSGGASRFFPTFRYEAKAPTTERPRDGQTAHPTVKPLDLMRWLVRLVTPPGGTVLDPFAGSGTTAEACVIKGFNCITVEREADYLPLIVQRLSKPIQVTLDLDGIGS